MTSWLAAHGGFVGLGVLAARYVLIGFSVASLAVVLERLWMLRRARLAEARDYRRILTALINDDQIQLRAVALQSAAPCGAVLSVGLEHLGSSEARLREATQSEVGAQIESLQHNLPILATAASTAPYVGLFGTVLGILAAFRDIAHTGQTGASVIAGGISEALISTALGLGVAIPAVMAYNYFSARINTLSSLVETHALDVTERMVGMASKGELPIMTAPNVTAPVVGPVSNGGAKSVTPTVNTVASVSTPEKVGVETPDDITRANTPSPEKKKTISALEAMKRGTPLIEEDGGISGGGSTPREPTDAN